MDDREARFAGHPPACTCAMCERRRLANVSYGTRVKGCPVCNGSAEFRFHYGQYWDVFVGYDGRMVEPQLRAKIGEASRFRCRGCDGIVGRDEIDDPSLSPDAGKHNSLPKPKDEIHEHWERQRRMDGSVEERRAARRARYFVLFLLIAFAVAAVFVYLTSR